MLPQEINALLLRAILVNVVPLIAVLDLESELKCGSTLPITEHRNIASLVLTDNLA